VIKQFLKGGLALKTLVFALVLMTLVMVVTLGILYVFLPGYYFRHKNNQLTRNADILQHQLNAGPSIEESAALIAAFSGTNNATVIAVDSEEHMIPELSTPFLWASAHGVQTNVMVTYMERRVGSTGSSEETAGAGQLRIIPREYFGEEHGQFQFRIGGAFEEGVAQFRIGADSPGMLFRQQFASVSLSRDIDHPDISRITVSGTLQPIDEAQAVIISMIPYLLPVGFVIALLLSFLFARQLERNATLEQSKTDFMRAAGHELKTPIAALSGMLDGMIDGVGPYKDHDKYLSECKAQTERLAKLVNEILLASKTERTDGVPHRADVDVAELLDEAIYHYKALIEKKDLKLETDFNFKLRYHTDRRVLLTVLSNLLSNAVNYTNPGGRIWLTLSRLDEGAFFSIENECPPVDALQLPKWFEPFFTPDYSRDKAKSGTGLGLYIVKKNLETLELPFEAAATDRGVRFEIKFLSGAIASERPGMSL